MTDNKLIQFKCIRSYRGWRKGETYLMTVDYWENLPSRQYYWTPIKPTELFMRITALHNK